MDQPAVVDLDRDPRRAPPHLGRVVEAQPPAARWRAAAARRRRRRRSGSARASGCARRRGRRAPSASRSTASTPCPVSAEQVRTGGRSRSFLWARARASSRSRSARDEVPLVEREHGRAARPHRQLADPQVLGGEPLGGVADDDRRVGALGGALGAKLRVVADGPGDLAAAAQPGGVDQHDVAPVELELGVDRVAGGSGALGDDHPLGAEQRVQQRGLADVGPPDDRDRGAPPRRSSSAPGPPSRARGDAVEQVAGAEPVGGRDGQRLAEPEASGAPRPAPRLPGGRSCWRRPGRASASAAAGRPARRRRGPSPARASTTSRITSASSIAVRACACTERASSSESARSTPPVSIRSKRDAVPLARQRAAVAGDPRLGVGDRLAAAGEAVDQGALAGVGKADDGDLGRPLRSLPRAPARAPAATTRSTTSSASSPVVSSSTASSAARRAPCSRSRSRSSRARIAASTSSAVLAALGRPPARPLLLARGQEDLQRRVRADHGADVAALGHVAPGLDQLALARDHRLADLRVDRDPRGGGRDLGRRGSRSLTSRPSRRTTVAVELDLAGRGRARRAPRRRRGRCPRSSAARATQRYIAPESR